MALRLSERVQAALFLGILVAAIAGLYATTQLLQPAAVPRFDVHGVRLEIEATEWTLSYAVAATPNNTAFSLLLEAAAGRGFSVEYEYYEIPSGVFVTAINGFVNGDGGRYWQYWVTGAYGTVAADRKALADNDVVLWKFDVSREGS